MSEPDIDTPELTDRQENFLAWLLLTKEERAEQNEPPSEAQWAAANNVPQRQLRRWKHQSRVFMTAYRDAIYRNHTSPENMQQVLDKMREQILDGTASPSLMNKYLERLDKMVPPPTLTEETVGVAELDDRRLVRAVIDAAALRGWTVLLSDEHGNPISDI